MIATVIISSISVKPRARRRCDFGHEGPSRGEQGGPGPKPRPSGFTSEVELELALAVERVARTDRVEQVLRDRRAL